MIDKKETHNAGHEFAFYYSLLSDILQDGQESIVIVCDDLYHRFKHVLRMQSGDRCILFDKVEHVSFIFTKFEGKNKIVGQWVDRKLNQRLKPEITFLLPLLKIDGLSDAIYSLAEVGITKIQLISTQKTQTAYSQKLFDKLERAAIAAAEQSKMFAFPQILAPVKLEDWLERSGQVLKSAGKYHFDVTGVPFSSWYQPLQVDRSYYLLVGPEGDLTDDEKLLVKNAGFQSCFLTPTVLRSVRAISLISGLFRL